MSHIGAVIDCYESGIAAENQQNYLKAARYYRLCILFYENGELPVFYSEVQDDANDAYSRYEDCRSRLIPEAREMLDTEKSKYVNDSYLISNWQRFVDEEEERLEMEKDKPSPNLPVKRFSRGFFFMIVITLVLFILGLFFFASCKGQPSPSQPETHIDPYYDTFLPNCATTALPFATEHGLNEDYCLFVDYSLPSGGPRVFLWSFVESKVVFKAHTMHGSGGGSTPENAVLSNVSGSNCSAPGHFEITRDQGATIRPSFRLKGLDSSNANAYDRGIMLHGAWLVDECLADKVEYFPLDVIWCAGCVTTSTKEMTYLKSFIDVQSKRMLLWTFKSEQLGYQ